MQLKSKYHGRKKPLLMSRTNDAGLFEILIPELNEIPSLSSPRPLSGW
jgi:hypothetical protein